MNKIRLAWLLGLVLLTIAGVRAQECGTHEVFRRALRSHPGLGKEAAGQEAFIEAFTEQLADIRGTGDDPRYVIPVVFHVIHSGRSDNISRGQLLAALQRLNDDFNRRNSDAGEVPPPFEGLAANVQVAFRLATLDPDGHCTDGIVRVYSPGIPRRESELLELSRWPVDRYLNVWIAPAAVDESGVAYGAYARFPQSGDPGNGIFISARFLGDPYLLTVESDLLTHEAGHWLNLTHIWGNTNDIDPDDGCRLDDFVDDTPRQAGANTGCPAFPHFSCDGAPHGDNFSNFMDYSSCRNMFTQGQRDRMWAALNSALAGRNRLWTPENLAAAGVAYPDEDPDCPRPPRIDFGWGRYYDVYCADQPIAFYATASGAEARQWSWTFSGGTPRTSTAPAPQVRFEEPGDYWVELIAANDYGRDTVSRIIRVGLLSEKTLYPAGAPPEGFEDESRFGEYAVFDSFYDGSWTLATGTSRGSGRHSLQLANPTFPAAAIPVSNSSDGLVTPYFDLGTAAGGTLSFYIAYNSLLPAEDAKPALRISAFPGCDPGERLPIATLNAGAIETPQYVFPPLQESFWKRITLPLPAEIAAWERGRFIFELIHRRGEVQLVYIDDIALEPAAITSVAGPGLDGWRLAPNPASSSVTVMLPEGLPRPVQLTIMDVTGRRLRTLALQGDGQRVDIHELAGGLYFLELRTRARRSVRRLVIVDP